jgi:hypothetical protein
VVEVIPQSEVHRLLGVARRALELRLEDPPRSGTGRLQRALTDLRVIERRGLVTRAYRQLAQMSGTLSSSSGGGGTRPAGPGAGDTTGELATARRGDPVQREVADLEQRLRRLQRDSMLTLKAGASVGQLAGSIETDARELRFSFARWAREPDVRWCTHCLKTNGHREPVAPGGRFADVCLRCGLWRKANGGALPPRRVLEYLQRGETPPAQLLAQLRLKLPRERSRRR